LAFIKSEYVGGEYPVHHVPKTRTFGVGVLKRKKTIEMVRGQIQDFSLDLLLR
jgi:hypothetical protein